MQGILYKTVVCTLICAMMDTIIDHAFDILVLEQKKRGRIRRTISNHITFIKFNLTNSNLHV